MGQTLQERIREAMHTSGVTPAALSREARVTSVAVHKWRSGQTKRMQYEVCERVAAALRVTPEWLNYGEGPRVCAADHEARMLKLRLATLAVLETMLAQQRELIALSTMRREK